MKTSLVLFALLFGVVVFVAETSARPNHGQTDSTPYDENRDETLSDIGKDRDYDRRGRRIRHSRQIAKGYDYLSPWSYESDRKYIILQELQQIKQLLEELPDSLKNRQQGSVSPQQPSYIPIPIYLPAQGTQCTCGNSKKNIVPHFDNRFGSEEVIVWGSEEGENAVEGDDDGARPISFKPIKVNPQGVPPPPVEHGSVQAGVSTTAAPLTTETPILEPNRCEAAILSCCRFTNIQQRQCFQFSRCEKTYETGIACTPIAIQKVIAHFKKLYAPR